MDSASRPHRDGLYVNYGLKALNIHGGQKLTLAEHGGAYGATAGYVGKNRWVKGSRQSIRCDRFRFPTVRTTIRGNLRSDGGTLRTDADGDLWTNTRN